MTRAILFVHPSDELYGADRCLLEIVKGLPETDRAVVALPTDIGYDGALSRELKAAGAEVRYVDMLVLRRSLLSPRSLPSLAVRFLKGTRVVRELIQENHATLVHSNTVAVVCGASAAAVTRSPHVWHIHEHLGDEPLPYRLAIRFLLALAPGVVVANSEPVARAIAGRSRLLARKIRIVRNALRGDIEPPPVIRALSQRPVIGVAGRLSPRKGIAEALEAAALLKARGRCFEMRFVGATAPGQEWRLGEYGEMVHDLGLRDYVSFSGERVDMAATYQEFDILLFPSQRPEAFGLVVIEGMATGLPVVATRNGGGSDELLDDGVTGLYCDRSPASIASTLEQLLQDPALARSIGSAARQEALRRYSLDRYRGAFQRIFDRLAGDPATLNPLQRAGTLARGSVEGISHGGQG